MLGNALSEMQQGCCESVNGVMSCSRQHLCSLWLRRIRRGGVHDLVQQALLKAWVAGAPATTNASCLTWLQEIKLGDAQRTRALFERAIHLQLKAKQMKFLFKRYLQYEQQHGDEATVAHVKEAALAYVNQHVE